MSRSRYRSAVGLEFDPEHDQAPGISINADALLADEVVKLARRFGVPVVEDSGLARALHSLPEDAEIPEELYEAVAVLLSGLRSLKQPF